MQRYKLEIEYDGTPFVGWQFQKNGLSIQEVLQKAVFNLSKEKVVITGAGRTDSGVHALAQVAHFDVTEKFLQTSWTVNPQKVIDGFNFIYQHQLQMWRSLTMKMEEYESEQLPS